MLRSVIRAFPLALLIVSGCTNSTIRSQEGHACSTNSSDDPQLLCTPAQDLVCIATYTRTVTNPAEAAKFDGGIRQVYVCRLNCNVTADCPQQGDVCCPGVIFGKTYGKMGGCTPPSACEAMGGGDEDGGAGDAGTPADAGAKSDGGKADGATAPDAPTDTGAADGSPPDTSGPAALDVASAG
jgi:hypothetical protein